MLFRCSGKCGAIKSAHDRSARVGSFICDNCKRKGVRSIVVQERRVTVRSQKDIVRAFMHNTAHVVKR